MSKKPFVSVIVVNYNGERFIKECVDSVLKSNYLSFEIVVVENASTDNSYELLKKNYENKEKVKIVRSNKQLYFAGGSNLGARNSKGEKFIFLNSDTVVKKDWMKGLVDFSRGHKKYLVQPKILFFKKKNTIDSVGGNYNFFGFGLARGRGEKDNGQYNQSVLVDYANGTVFMIDRKFFEKLGGFDEWYQFYYEDVDLNLRAKKLGGQSWYCDRSIVYHKGSLTIKKNIFVDDLIFHIRRNRLRTVIKNFKGPERILRVAILLLVAIFLAIQDLLRLQPKKALVFFKAVLAILNYEHKVLIEKLRLQELKAFIRKRNFSLLDLGCGDGLFLKLALKNNIEALGVDKSFPSHPEVISSSIENLKLNKKFDVVTMFHVLEHIRKPKETFGKVKTFLKKDGVLVIEIPLVGNFTEKFLKRNYFAYHDQSHIHLFTRKEIFELLDQAGWIIKKKGFTLLEFPFTVLTTSLRKGLVYGLEGLFLFLPFKMLSILGFNDEIIRLYCIRKNSMV